MKRVFTKYLGGSYQMPATTITTVRTVDQYTAQEDLMLVGAQLHVYNGTVHLGNDGKVAMDAELGTSGVDNQDTCILSARSLHIWNTAPAAIPVSQPPAGMMLPEGKGIPLKEGETVFLTLHGNNTSAGVFDVALHATLYYVKGKPSAN